MPATSLSWFVPSVLADWETRCAAALAELPRDAAHDAEHVRRVVANARALCAIEGAPYEIVVPAAWLHDCVVLPKDSPERRHASRLAADRAGDLLREWGYPSELIPEVEHAISAHSFSAGIEPRTLAAKVVQDADRLDALGAIGLARCLMLSVSLDRPLYDPADPLCERRMPDDSRSALDHFFTKLLKLPGQMKTAAGRAEAEVRVAVLRTYLVQLKRELDVRF